MQAEVEPGLVLLVRILFCIGQRAFCTWQLQEQRMAGWLEVDRVGR